LLLVIVWPLLARLDFYGAQLGRRLAYPFFQGSSEGLILSEVALIRQGGSIYLPFRGDLFISAPYPPLYYYLTAWVSGLAGAAETNFTVGRVISLVSAWVSGLLIAWQVFFFRPPAQNTILARPHLFLKGAIAALAGLVFVTLPAVVVWSARVRADMLMTALQLAGLALAGEGVRRQRFGLTIAAIVPFTLALYTKQTALAGPVAALVFVAFAYGRHWRKTAAWLIAQGLAAGLPFLALNFTTNGELFRRLFKYHNLPWLLINFEDYAGLFVQENLGLLILGVILIGLALAGMVVRLRTGHPSGKVRGLDLFIEAGRQVPLAVWYLVGSLALLAGLGVAGADHNHFLPAEAATCLAAGICLVWLLYAGRGRWVSLLGLAGLGLQLALWSVPAPRYEIELRTRDADYQRQLGRIIAYAAAKPGPILTSEAGFFVLAGKSPRDGPYYNDLFTLAALDRQGLYSAAGLLQAVRRKQFSVVLAEGDLFNGAARPDVWTPELVEALKENYFLKFTDVWYTYEPKP
jgi:hypothetical protein